jgi:hypothetical protein
VQDVLPNCKSLQSGKGKRKAQFPAADLSLPNVKRRKTTAVKQPRQPNRNSNKFEFCELFQRNSPLYSIYENHRFGFQSHNKTMPSFEYEDYQRPESMPATPGRHAWNYKPLGALERIAPPPFDIVKDLKFKEEKKKDRRKSRIFYQLCAKVGEE